MTEFEQAYGPDGLWVRLFKRASGYLRTELYRDRSNPARYLTIDYWESPQAWEAFRSGMSSEFEAIDQLCEAYAIEEREIGRFDPVAP